MPVIGMTINNISGKRTEDYAGPSNIGHQTSIKSVDETDMKSIGKKGLRVGFEFSTIYNTDKEKKFGEIVISGDVFFLAENPAEILMGWKKEKKLPEDANLQIINTVIRRCVSKAIVLSEDVNLPPPIPIPFAHKGDVGKEPTGKKTEDTSRYIG